MKVIHDSIWMPSSIIHPIQVPMELRKVHIFVGVLKLSKKTKCSSFPSLMKAVGLVNLDLPLLFYLFCLTFS